MILATICSDLIQSIIIIMFVYYETDKTIANENKVRKMNNMNVCSSFGN